MNDLVERLRHGVNGARASLDLRNKAEDEIARLRAALKDIASKSEFPDEYSAYSLGAIAERALSSAQ